jgi:hypothetical protein
MNKIVGFYLYFICISYEYCMHEYTCPVANGPFLAKKSLKNPFLV